MKVSAFSCPLYYCSCEICSKLYFSTEFEVCNPLNQDELIVDHVIDRLCKLELKGCVNGVPNKPFLPEYMYISYDSELDILYIDTTSSDYLLVPAHQSVE